MTKGHNVMVLLIYIFLHPFDGRGNQFSIGTLKLGANSHKQPLLLLFYTEGVASGHTLIVSFHLHNGSL